MLAIKAENISKQYRLGQVGTGTLSHDLNRFYHKLRGKEDPYLKIGDSNDRSTKGESEYVWSLRDINFEIEQGDAVGIIGRNGAGKSTLLKLLSKVTKPTTGSIKSKGRIASLLEVGTGFHPEMTGRENIFLNGAILGMTRKEITRKFDEIVDFSGVERYIDTPVKRYSSGMYVRLAFAVAAHLESEILIVDEVLAVGDADFQKKCLGKMGDVTKSDGRTILFVSHNMAAVQNLCSKGILLENGTMKHSGSMPSIITKYLEGYKPNNFKISDILERQGNGTVKIIDGYIMGINTVLNLVETFCDFEVCIELDKEVNLSEGRFKIDIGINNNIGVRVAWLSNSMLNIETIYINNKIIFLVKNSPLAPGNYSCNIYCEYDNEVADWVEEVLPFKIVEKDYYKTGRVIPENQGNVLLDFKIKS